MLILGIETSCDETAAAVVEKGTRVRSNVIASSIAQQAAYGGVVPEIAARRQVEFVVPVIDGALEQARTRPEHIDAIAVTKGPGLLASLLVGVMAARTLASVWRKPLIGVHHTLGHLDSPWLETESRSFGNGVPEREIRFPVLTLSVSGGHTELWLRGSHTRGALLGSTRDDAAGEAFDKGALLLGLPYPGGPALSKLAEGGNPRFAEFGTRHSVFGKSGMDFSFSGLKTALKYFLRDRGGLQALPESEKKDVAASYQEAICDHLVSRVERALELHPVMNEIHLVGGVAANSRLRALMAERLVNCQLSIVNLSYCTDNAAMIAAAGYFMLRETGKKAFEPFETAASMALSSG